MLTRLQITAQYFMILHIATVCNFYVHFISVDTESFPIASLQQSMPHAQPTIAELEEMSRRAMAVVRLLSELRQSDSQDDNESITIQPSAQNTPEESRPPKRPWEDVSQDDGATGSEVNGFQDVSLLLIRFISVL